MNIVSWNVAGLRACEKKGLYEWYLRADPDVLCLQETKALPEQLSARLVHPDRHEAHYVAAEKKGYSGVSTWVRKGINVKHTVGLGIEKFDREGRTLISEFDNFFLINCYFPNGQRDHGRVPYKLEYSEEVSRLALKLKSTHHKEVIITGDFNTAHHEIDLANPKANQKTTGFLPCEREWMGQFASRGFVDIFRHFTPQEGGHYTWWTYRNDCRERNIGWRIDYFWCTNEFLSKSVHCRHLIEVHGSDHCPIELAFT